MPVSRPGATDVLFDASGGRKGEGAGGQEDFIELSGEAEVGEGTIWRVIIHLTFVLSGVLFALMDWIADKREFHGTHK